MRAEGQAAAKSHAQPNKWYEQANRAVESDQFALPVTSANEEGADTAEQQHARQDTSTRKYDTHTHTHT